MIQDSKPTLTGKICCCLTVRTGSHGASKNVQIVAFPTARQAVDYLRNECHCVSILGLMGPIPDGYRAYNVKEDMENPDRIIIGDPQDDMLLGSHSTVGNRWIEGENDGKHSSNRANLDQWTYPVYAMPRVDGSGCHGNTCFALTKDRSGSFPLLLAHYCDAFVHVPHLPLNVVSQSPAPQQNLSSGFNSSEANKEMILSSTLSLSQSTSSPSVQLPHLLDVPSCLAIVLHEFMQRAGSVEHFFHDYKYQVVRPNDHGLHTGSPVAPHQSSQYDSSTQYEHHELEQQRNSQMIGIQQSRAHTRHVQEQLVSVVVDDGAVIELFQDTIDSGDY